MTNAILNRFFHLVCAGLLLLSAPSPAVEATPARKLSRLKEMISLEGVRDNQLVGYGLVVGLAGTGDKRQTVFSAQSLSNLLERMGVTVAATALQAKNTAAVMVAATLPPFAQPGVRVDVTAAAMGDSTNLQGGLLLLTPLKAANGQVFAVAQGPVVTGGFVASGGGGGTTQTVNHPTTGRVPNGAIVESAPPSTLNTSELRLQLKHGDFTNATRVSALINRTFGEPGRPVSKPLHAGLVVVTVPPEFTERAVEFYSLIENLSLEIDRVAKIVVNERTGTIVMGKEVRISPVSILHGNLTVEVEISYDVSQPAPLSSGETTVVPKVGVGVKEEKARNINLKEGASVEDLVRALMIIGSTPRDVIAILQNLQAAGALNAELEVI
jgi:flagellar P-ring protein FlgI